MGSPMIHMAHGIRTNARVKEFHQVDYMPADPACRMLKLVDGKPWFGPLVCWQLKTISILDDRDYENYVAVSLIGPDGVEDDAYVLFPDGKVYRRDEYYDSVEEWLRYATAEEAYNEEVANAEHEATMQAKLRADEAIVKETQEKNEG